MTTKEFPRWDMTNVYPSIDSDEFITASKKLVAMVEDLKSFIKENQIDPEQPPKGDTAALAGVIESFIQIANQALELEGTLEAYLYSFMSTDSYNNQALKAFSELEQIQTELNQQIEVLFTGWVGKLAGQLPEIIKQNETVKSHAFFLKEAAEQSQYLMSSTEEGLAAELNLSGAQAWAKLQNTITSQLKWEIKNEKDEVELMPMTAIINLRAHANPVMRQRGYEAEAEAWKSVENQLAACLNGIKGAVNVLDRRRGRQDALHSSIDTARIDRETLEAMLQAMEDFFPTIRKYYKSKAQKLGKEKLAWYDLYAPLGKSDKTFSYPEAQQYVLDNFTSFSKHLVDFTQKAYDNNWIDVGPRDGKGAGAFCMGIPAVKESRVFLNFDGTLGWVFTLAHELGHGYHNECLKERTMLQSTTPMTMAETASIMCENIVLDAAIKNAADEQEELSILETSLISDAEVIVDIYSRYLFEKEVFERRVKSELSADDLSEIMLRAQQETYGDGLDENLRQKYMWTWKPHYYIPGLSFYNYPYTFGMLFSTSLYAIYKERGEEFVPQYRELLGSTGLGTAAELAARFDLDLRDPAFWQGGLSVVGEKIERYIEL